MIGPEWFCGCGAADPEKCLAEILNCFVQTEHGPYANLDKFDELYKKYDRDAVELICYFLDHLGYMWHSGSVCCSQWLTDEGVKLREWANSQETT